MLRKYWNLVMIYSLAIGVLLIAPMAYTQVRMSMDQYRAVQTGMTYLEVVKVMGRAGEETMRSESGGFQIMNET